MQKSTSKINICDFLPLRTLSRGAFVLVLVPLQVHPDPAFDAITYKFQQNL